MAQKMETKIRLYDGNKGIGPSGREVLPHPPPFPAPCDLRVHHDLQNSPTPVRVNSMIMMKLFYVSTGSYFTLCWSFYSLNSCQKFRTLCSSSGALLPQSNINNQLRNDYHFYHFSGCLLRPSS